MGAIWEPVQTSWLEPRLTTMRSMVNDHEYFGGDNDLEIPDVPPCLYIPERLAPWHHRKDYPGAAVHFFLHDYRFESVWRNPPGTLPRLAEAEAVIGPDFSLWSEMPWPVSLWQIYRSRWMSAYWHARGLRVIPEASWSVPAQAWHFTGLPRHSTIAFQTQNGAKDPDKNRLEADAIRMLQDLLEPVNLLSYGPFSEGVTTAPGVKVVEYPTFAVTRLHRLDDEREETA